MKTRVLVIGTLLVFLVATGATWVMAQSGETILACAAKDGTLRIIADRDECKKKGTVYEWYAATVVDALLGDEAAARSAADADVQADIVAEAAARSTADDALQANIDAEAVARLAADGTLQANIDAEAAARSAADAALQANIDAEVAARSVADAALHANIDAEAAARLAADDILQANIDAIDTMVKADPPCFDNANRYVDCGNGTVHDTVTNLIWLKNADCYGQLDYAAANNAAAGLEDGECGLTDGSSPGDWRLPTGEEWEATVARAVEMNCAVPPSEPPYLTNTPGTACYHAGPKQFTGVRSDWYWASTAYYQFPDSADYAHLGLGYVSTWNHKTNAGYVWPVRGGK